MSSPLKCSLCGKPAVVHLTQIVNNKSHKMDLCEECAKTKGVTSPEGFPLSDLLVQALSAGIEKAQAANALHCESCGLTVEDFKKTGRFGCPHCYATFGEMLAPMLENMHKGLTHRGKVPARAVERKTREDSLRELETQLQSAIKDERYEDAARYRDEIHRIQQAPEAVAKN